MTLSRKVLVVIASVVVIGTVGPWVLMHNGSHGSPLHVHQLK
jgi:hypothetical protein